jgi:hypothetical protein
MQTFIVNRELRPCILVRLACIKCGPVRMALTPREKPITALECPYCFTEAKAQQIGTGRTLRALPYFEFESKQEALITALPQFGNGRERLTHGQLVVYCQETSILHLAAVGDIHTNRASLSPDGIPSISFTIGENETGPVPHVSAAPGCPPWWCLPEEVRAALKKSRGKK